METKLSDSLATFKEAEKERLNREKVNQSFKLAINLQVCSVNV